MPALPPTSRVDRARSLVYGLLEDRRIKRRSAVLIDGFLVLLISLNIAALVAETVRDLDERYGNWFDGLLWFSVIVFSIEYLLRVWVCTCHPDGRFKEPVRGRLSYVLSPMALLDLLSVAPFLLAALIGFDLRFLRILRLLWLLKVARYLPAVGMLGRVLHRERRTLAAIFVVMMVMLFVVSTLVYLLERDLQPEHFSSIPQAMWWGIVTLTTVGYGDLVPLSPLGRLLGMFTMLMGIATFALPAGVLASAFAEERKRRDFILAWDLVAQVPVFAGLNAHEIADIAALLHPRDVLPKEVIFYRGDAADSMYFIVSGELEVDLGQHLARMGPGQYVGEVALIYHQPRSATVSATTRGELLELYATDLQRLFDCKPRLREQIVAEAGRRQANPANTESV